MWLADLKNGNYRNPVLYADYSDPDAIRVGDDYFMISSSFCNAPALPVLHSKDLVNWKVVNYNITKEDKEKGKIECPKCHSEKVIKFGFYNGIQRYKCKNEDCCKTFIDEKSNPFRYSKKFKENWEQYFELFIKGLSLRECAAKMGITLVTAFFWRHRFLADLCEKSYIKKIGSYVELTKLVLYENFKGDRGYHGEERDKIIVVNALNDYMDISSIIAGRKFLVFYEIRDNIIPRIDAKAYVVGFQDSRLKMFANALNEIRNVKLREDINELKIDLAYSNKVKKWLIKFNGVASKYLDHYLSWRAFEYKNNTEYERKNIFSMKKVYSQINVKAKISTYISWGNIKKRTIEI